MRRALWAVLALGVLLSGCVLPVRSREADQLLPVETLGYDGVPGAVTVSVSARGLDEEGDCRLSGRGETISLAINDAREWAPREELFFAHIRFAVAGEAAARSGLEGLLDYFERSTQTRLDLPLLIVRDATAEELVTGSADPKYEITELLTALQRENEKMGSPHCFTVLDTARQLAESGVALCCAVTADSAQAAVASAEDALAARAAGYAVLKDGALAGFLSPEAAVGADLLLGLAGECVYALPDGQGGTVTVVLRSSGAQLSPDRDSETPTVRIKLSARAGILEADGADPLAPGRLEALDARLSAAMERQCAAALEAAVELDADFLGLEGLWKDLPLPEEGLLPALAWRIDSRGVVERSYDVSGRVPAEGEGGSDGQ